MSTLTHEGQPKNKSFREVYMGLPTAKEKLTAKQAFIKRIAKITMKHEQTIKYWISGTQNPDPLCKSIIEKELGIPANVLFPEKDPEPCEK